MTFRSSTIMGAVALIGLPAITLNASEIRIISGDDDGDMQIFIEREADDGRTTREHYNGHEFIIDEDNDDGQIMHMRVAEGNTIHICTRVETNDSRGSTLNCTSGDFVHRDGSSNWHAPHRRHQSRWGHYRSDRFSGEMRTEFEAEMRELEQEMAELGREMAELAREMPGMGRHFTHMAHSASHIGDVVTAHVSRVFEELEQNGIRMESDDHGNETVWVRSDDDDEPSIRVLSSSEGESLVFMYFDGFDEDYHFVIEDDDEGDDHTIIHAYDIGAVTIIESRNSNSNIEANTSNDGTPELTVHTRHPDRIRVLRLDRRRFDD